MLPRTCLIVDDDSAVRHYVGSVLNRDGFVIWEAQDGVKALDLALRLGDALDLIVTDIEMPGGDGVTFACSLHQANPDIPVVLMSGSEAFSNKGSPKPLFEFLQKPFGPVQLLETIRRVHKLKGASLGPSARDSGRPIPSPDTPH